MGTDGALQQCRCVAIAGCDKILVEARSSGNESSSFSSNVVMSRSSFSSSSSERMSSGPPWRMRLWVRYHDSAARGGVKWRGCGTQYAQLRWGKLQHDYIANDTQAVAEYLERVRTTGAIRRSALGPTPFTCAGPLC